MMSGEFNPASFRQLAEFRFQIRKFVHFSEQSARKNGIEPQQHQLLLAIKGLPEGTRPTVTALAHRLSLRHHSTVELINRMVARGVVARQPSGSDRREVLVELTPLGEEILNNLSVIHTEELQTSGPQLLAALEALTHRAAGDLKKSA